MSTLKFVFCTPSRAGLHTFQCIIWDIRCFIYVQKQHSLHFKMFVLAQHKTKKAG